MYLLDLIQSKVIGWTGDEIADRLIPKIGSGVTNYIIERAGKFIIKTYWEVLVEIANNFFVQVSDPESVSESSFLAHLESSRDEFDLSAKLRELTVEEAIDIIGTAVSDQYERNEIVAIITKKGG